MTKQDWAKVGMASLVSVFLGLIVLAAIILSKQKSLSKSVLKRIVSEDLQKWQGLKETDRKGAEMIADYWKLIGWNFSVDRVMTQSFQNQYFWSAIYISNLMHKWGADNRFKYSSSHSTYILDGKRAKQAGDRDAIFYSYAPDKATVEVGDLVGVSRKPGVNFYNLYQGAPTHTDLVFDLKKTDSGYDALAIGGNVGNTVAVTTFKLDKDKRLINPSKYLTVMKNQKI